MQEPEDRLRDLGVFLKETERCAEDFRSCSSQEALETRMIENGSSLNGEQFLFTFFYALRNKHPEVLEKALSQLPKFDLPDEIVRGFMESEQQPSYGMSAKLHLYCMRHNIPDETRKKYREELQRLSKSGNAVALREVRAYLGFS